MTQQEKRRLKALEDPTTQLTYDLYDMLAGTVECDQAGDEFPDDPDTIEIREGENALLDRAGAWLYERGALRANEIAE